MFSVWLFMMQLSFCTTPRQRTHDAMISSLLGQNDVTTSLWRYNDVIFASCVRWGYMTPDTTLANSGKLRLGHAYTITTMAFCWCNYWCVSFYTIVGHASIITSIFYEDVITHPCPNLHTSAASLPDWYLLSSVPDYFDRNKILSGYDLSHYQVPHCIRVFFYFVWFVFIHHNFQFYFKLCTYCNILDIYLS